MTYHLKEKQNKRKRLRFLEPLFHLVTIVSPVETVLSVSNCSAESAQLDGSQPRCCALSSYLFIFTPVTACAHLRANLPDQRRQNYRDSKLGSNSIISNKHFLEMINDERIQTVKSNN